MKLVILHENLEDDPARLDLAALGAFVDSGPGVLVHRDDGAEVLDGKEAAYALGRAGSDPAFFHLDENGSDAEESQCGCCGWNEVFDDLADNVCSECGRAGCQIRGDECRRGTPVRETRKREARRKARKHKVR